MIRQQFIIGNWKMHKTCSETQAFIATILSRIGETTQFVGIAPSFTSIQTAANSSKGSYLNIGAQNISEYDEGAYTGEVSAKMVKEAGGTFVLLGHSERRIYFGEKGEMIQNKIKRAIKEYLLPIFCLGETEEQREKGQTASCLSKQLEEGLDGLSQKELQNLALAYEPLWAIGTGRSIDPLMAQETHQLIRKKTGQIGGEELQEMIPILYGGSVTPQNVSSLLKERDIDGVLVGGASLDTQSFAKIIEIGKQLV